MRVPTAHIGMTSPQDFPPENQGLRRINWVQVRRFVSPCIALLILGFVGTGAIPVVPGTMAAAICQVVGLYGIEPADPV